jgi:ketosteroid isomerase-like protein
MIETHSSSWLAPVDDSPGQWLPAPARGNLQTFLPVARTPERIVSLWFDAFNARDLEGLLALFDPRIDLYPLKLSGLEGSYRGHAGVRAWFADLERRCHDCRLDLSEVHSVVEGKVVAFGSLRLVGELETPSFCAVHRISAGLIVAAHHCVSDPEMIEHLGLIP